MYRLSFEYLVLELKPYMGIPTRFLVILQQNEPLSDRFPVLSHARRLARWLSAARAHENETASYNVDSQNTYAATRLSELTALPLTLLDCRRTETAHRLNLQRSEVRTCEKEEREVMIYTPAVQ